MCWNETHFELKDTRKRYTSYFDNEIFLVLRKTVFSYFQINELNVSASVNTFYEMNHVINLLIYVFYIRKEQNIRKSLFYCLRFLLLMVVWTGLRNIWSRCFKPCSKSINVRSIRFVNWLQLPLNRWFISSVYFMVLVIGIRDQSNCKAHKNTTFIYWFKLAIFYPKNLRSQTKYQHMDTELI